MITVSKNGVLLAFLVAILASGLVAAQVEDLKVRTDGQVTYVSGGVGASEQEALEQVKSEYNLRLLFAVTGSGEFLAAVPVTIAQRSGEVVLNAVSDGPYLYARVPPGDYSVSAEYAGQVQTRSVTVPASGAVSREFYWAGEP